MDWNSAMPLIISIVGAIGSYLKIKEYQDKKFNEKFLEMKQYTDKEMKHLREVYDNEFKKLEKKIDALQEEVRENQKQLISLLMKQ